MARNPIVEQWLEQHVVPWTFEPIPVAEVDTEASRNNQARPGLGNKLRADWVSQYTIAMCDGADFPAIVAYRGPHGYILISGNHRHAAAVNAQRETLDCYVVEVSSSRVVEMLTRTANFLEGQRGTASEALTHAMFLVQRMEYTRRDAARMCGVAEDTLYGALMREKTDLRLGNLTGNNDHTALPAATRQRLGNVRSDPVLVEAFQVVREYALDTTLTNQLVTEINAKHSETEQLDVIARWKARPEIEMRAALTQRGKRKLPPAVEDQVLSKMHQLNGFLERAITGKRADPERIRQLQEQWHAIEVRMRTYLAWETPNGRTHDPVARTAQ